MAQIEFNLNLKHAMDAAINAVGAMNDLSFYTAHMPAGDASERVAAAMTYLTGAIAELRAYEKSAKPNKATAACP